MRIPKKISRLLFKLEWSIMRPKAQLPRSEQELYNILSKSVSSVGAWRKVAMGMGLKTSHLPEVLEDGEWCTDCPNFPEHLRGNCLEVLTIGMDKLRTERRQLLRKFHR